MPEFYSCSHEIVKKLGTFLVYKIPNSAVSERPEEFKTKYFTIYPESKIQIIILVAK